MAKLDLTEGKILNKLFKLAMPIILTGFIETANGLVDMMWIGKIGTAEVAAVGTASFYLWLSAAFIFLVRTGTEIMVAQKTGEKDHSGAKGYARAGIMLSIIIGLLFSIIMIVFRNPLIELFRIEDEEVVTKAVLYLVYVTPGIFFSFISKVMTGAFNGRGKSNLPFIANVTGLVVNIALDPILIFGMFGLPKMEVIGAALATSIAQLIALLILVYYIKVKKSLFDTFQLFKRTEFEKMKEIIKLGTPSCIFNAIFTLVGIAVAVIISQYGKEAIAAQKVGSQLEAISWMTAGGFSTAMSTFVGQNVGAKKSDRVIDGYFEAIKISVLLGLVNTFVLYVFSAPLMYIFFSGDPVTQQIGVDYLKILALSQLFMCIEVTTQGAFYGMGNTTIPSVTSTVFNLVRIPLAMFLAVIFGLNGVWWAITISSLLKGVFMVLFFIMFIKRHEEYKKYLKRGFSKKAQY